jgi:predicted nucleic acid-binding protein
VIVVDTSAVLAALLARPVTTDVDERLVDDGDLQAPHLIDVEFLHALRRLVRSRVLSEARASEVRNDFADLAIERYPHPPLADRMWELRPNLTAYDASFIVLSEALNVPLVTCDARLAASSGHGATVEVFRG